jgi:hypothetical protein
VKRRAEPDISMPRRRSWSSCRGKHVEGLSPGAAKVQGTQAAKLPAGHHRMGSYLLPGGRAWPPQPLVAIEVPATSMVASSRRRAL